MIVPFGKHLRQWFLGLAIATRNRVQTIVARLASVDQEHTAQDRREITPGDAKTARRPGPPDHWVGLVKRHAPELLQPAPPYVVTRAPSAVFESDPGMDGSAPQDIRDLRAGAAAPGDGDAPAPADPAYSFSRPRTAQAPDNPAGQQRMPAPDTKKQAGNDYRIAGADAAFPEHPRDDAATHGPVADRPGPARADRSAGSPAGEGKTLPRRASARVGEERSVPAKGPQSGLREAKIPETDPDAAPRADLPNGPIEYARAGGQDRKIIPASEQPGRRDERGYPKAPAHGAASLVDAPGPVQRKIKPAAGYDARTKPGESSRGSASSAGAGFKPHAAPTTGSEDDFRPANEVGTINDQDITSGPPARDKVAEKISSPAELAWPRLPGEKESNDVREAHLTATWPSLPEEPGTEAASVSGQVEPYPTEAETRNIERLRRLAEEQKGRSWSASHF